jgi:two-component sensor histidine kinase/tetratricopeptide (TPR) repeat protein
MIRRFCFKLTLLLFAGFIAIEATAQSSQWEKELGKIPGKVEKVEYLLKLSQDLEYGKGAFEPLQMAVKLAGETGRDSLLGKADFNLGAYYFTAGDLKTASSLFKKAKVLLLKAHCYERVASVIYWQSKLLVHTLKPDSLVRFLDKNQPIIRLSSSPKQRLNIQLMYGVAYMMLNKEAEAEKAYMALLPGAEMMQDTQLIISLCMNIGQLQHTFDSSMFWYNRVLTMTKQSDLAKYADLLADIGWTYSQQDDARKDSALYYYQEAEKYVEHMERPFSRMVLYNNTGEFFFQKQEYSMALPYFRKTIAILEQNELEVSVPYNNMALAFINLKQLDSAAYYRSVFEKALNRSGGDYERMLYYQLNTMYAKAKGDTCSVGMLEDYEKTIAYAVKLNDTRHATQTLVTEVMNCLNNKRYSEHAEVRAIARKIIAHCGVIYAMVKAEDKLVNFSEFLERYAALEELYGDKQKAMVLYKEIVTVHKETSEKKYREGVNETFVKYKTELKDAEILLLKQKDEASRTETRFILMGMAALALILVLIFVLYRRENKNKRELDIRNKKVEELLREIHHRVKNNLQIVSSFINIQLDKVKDKESVQSLMDTSRRIMALAGLHHSLYRQDDFSHIQLNEYIVELCSNIKNTMQLSTEVEMKYDLEKLQLDMDKAIPLGLALNELVTNALKYAFEGHEGQAEIAISLHRKEDRWELIVRDNGKGLPAHIDTTQKKSIGLRLVQNLVQRQVKGTLDSYNEHGAVFKITFAH